MMEKKRKVKTGMRLMRTTKKKKRYDKEDDDKKAV